MAIPVGTPAARAAIRTFFLSKGVAFTTFTAVAAGTALLAAVPSTGAAEFSPGAAEFSTGAAEFSPGAAEFSPGAAEFSTGAFVLPNV